MKRTALPHAPGATPVWTTHTYDGIGRTLSVTTSGSDTQGTTTYVYQGNTVTVTDPAGKWKKFTTDALGNLVQVNEPNPAGGADYVTTYGYDVLGHLTSVSMPAAHGDADAIVCVQRQLPDQRHQSGERNGHLRL